MRHLVAILVTAGCERAGPTESAQVLHGDPTTTTLALIDPGRAPRAPLRLPARAGDRVLFDVAYELVERAEGQVIRYPRLVTRQEQRTVELRPDAPRASSTPSYR